MNTKLTTLALCLYTLCYAGLFGTWALFVYADVKNAEQLVGYVQVALGALTGHIFTLVDPSQKWGVEAPPSRQGGFISFGLLCLIPLIAFALSGCSTLAAKEMQAASYLIDSEVESAELMICKYIPISVWQKRYGSTPERASAWDKLCNAPLAIPATPAIPAPAKAASAP